MAATTLTLFCLISGDSTSLAFPIEISSDKTVGALKKAIFEEKSKTFEPTNIEANNLVLWLAKIPVEKKGKITLDDLDKTQLDEPRTSLSKLSFNDNTYIIVERSKGTFSNSFLLNDPLYLNVTSVADKHSVFKN